MPRLHAAELVLREFEVGDAALIQEASADPVIPLITTVPTVDTVADALAFIERQHDRARNDVGYSYCIAMAATNEPIDQIGLWPESRDPGRASVGYWVIERWRGRGLAAVALAALTEWGFTTDGHGAARAVRRTLEHRVMAYRRTGRLPTRGLASPMADRRHHAA